MTQSGGCPLDPRSVAATRRNSKRPGPPPRAAVAFDHGTRRGVTPRAARVAALCLLPLALCLPACFGPKNYENENDRLRARVMDLEKEVQSLTAQRDENAAKLAEARRASPMDPEAADALPRCAAIEIGALSGPDHAPGEGPAPDRITLYLDTLDGLRRFVPVAGAVTIEAFWLPGPPAPSPGESAAAANAPDHQPVLIASRVFRPRDVRDAYRSGLAGTHYEFTLTVTEAQRPLLASRDGTVGTIILRAELRDAVTTQTHRAEKIITPR